jgi:hypothetical protein
MSTETHLPRQPVIFMPELYGSEVHLNIHSVVYLIYPVGTVRRNNREASPETKLVLIIIDL